MTSDPVVPTGPCDSDRRACDSGRRWALAGERPTLNSRRMAAGANYPTGTVFAVRSTEHGQDETVKRPAMAIGSVSASLVGVSAVLAAIAAGATIWLLLTDPVTVTAALNQGSITPLVRELAEVFASALRNLLHWL